MTSSCATYWFTAAMTWSLILAGSGRYVLIPSSPDHRGREDEGDHDRESPAVPVADVDLAGRAEADGDERAGRRDPGEPAGPAVAEHVLEVTGPDVVEPGAGEERACDGEPAEAGEDERAARQREGEREVEGGSGVPGRSTSRRRTA